MKTSIKKIGFSLTAFFMIFGCLAGAVPMLGKNKEVASKIFNGIEAQLQPCDSYYSGNKNIEALCAVYPDSVTEVEELDAVIASIEYVIKKTTKMLPANKDWGKGIRECAPCRSYALNGVTYQIIIDPWTNQMKSATGRETDNRPAIIVTTNIK